MKLLAVGILTSCIDSYRTGNSKDNYHYYNVFYKEIPDNIKQKVIGLVKKGCMVDMAQETNEDILFVSSNTLDKVLNSLEFYSSWIPRGIKGESKERVRQEASDVELFFYSIKQNFQDPNCPKITSELNTISSVIEDFNKNKTSSEQETLAAIVQLVDQASGSKDKDETNQKIVGDREMLLVNSFKDCTTEVNQITSDHTFPPEGEKILGEGYLDSGE